MAEQFLLRARNDGIRRHLEVHALSDGIDGEESVIVPVMKVVDTTYELRAFSAVNMLGYASPTKADVNPTEDVILPAQEAGAAVLAFFKEIPGSSLFYDVPDDSMHHLPQEFIVQLPHLIAEGICRTTTEIISELPLTPYNPSGPYL